MSYHFDHFVRNGGAAEIFLKQKQDPNVEYSYRLSSFGKLTTTDALPLLMQLLELAKQPAFTTDRFNRLESSVMDALYQIGINSEENNVKVKAAIEEFIATHQSSIEHVNFLHFNLRKIDEQFYMTKSKAYSITDAIKEYRGLQDTD